MKIKKSFIFVTLYVAILSIMVPLNRIHLVLCRKMGYENDENFPAEILSII